MSLGVPELPDGLRDGLRGGLRDGLRDGLPKLPHFFAWPMHGLERKFHEKYWNTFIPPCAEYPQGKRIDIFGLPVDNHAISMELPASDSHPSRRYNTRREFVESSGGEKRN